MGANIGTTATAWILTLGTLGASSTYLDLLKPSFFAPLIAFLPSEFSCSSKTRKAKHKQDRDRFRRADIRNAGNE